MASKVLRAATANARIIGPVTLSSAAWRGGEEAPERVQVVVRRGEQPDLLLAHSAGPGVEGADVEAAAELPGDRAAELFLGHHGSPMMGVFLMSTERTVAASSHAPLDVTAWGASAAQRPHAVQRP